MAESVHLDMTDVRLEFEPIALGTYHATVADCKIGPSKSSGQPTCFWQFELDTEEYQGRKLFYNTSLQSHALWKFGQTLEALGWTEEEIRNPEGLEFSPEDTIDMECFVVVTQEPYQGQIRNRVQQVLPVGDQSPQALAGEASLQTVQRELALQDALENDE